ncbi:hypothetical protein IQ279_25390 [Streptomyces verrucosisporus]|uniref:hypothetical protein n=1 Tax=Streptomyces verrucosisporus TaxID=1695161 RepID=UPI0019D28E32|nr:hypothetical protein [Streptomyces verrucosisporus]MBN3932901.1 hypothetical protein [Streptomyces verrucosisporus]
MTAATVVLALSACGQPGTGVDGRPRPASTATATAGEGDTPYLPDELLDAPGEPPRMDVVTESARIAALRIAVDWESLSGPAAGPPVQITWPRARFRADERQAEFEFGTTRVPSRVVLYEYPRVGDGGVPDETAGTETLCAFADRAAKCWRKGDGTAPARVVVPLASTSGPYWVIHAAWPVLTDGRPQDEVEVVSASWVVRIDRR